MRSVLGRFLEHSRFFVFEAGDSASTFMGSADLMTRNLDHRIEIAVPVEDPKVQAQLATAFDVLLEDNTAWTLQPDGGWKRLKPRKDQSAKGSHDALMRKARTRARRRVARRPR